LASGKVQKINGTQVLSGSGLGSGILASNLTSVGTISSGTWNGTSIGTTYTDAKVTSVAGATGAVSNAILSSGVIASQGSTGSGSFVLATSATLVTPNIGTPSYAVLTSATGLPVATGISGLGTGIATALAVNTGSAGAPVVNGGALGTPSGGTLTNCTFPTLNQSTTGSAATLTTSRNINGIAFNGSADITVTAAASTLTGSTLASGVTASSLTSVGTIGTGTWQGTSISTTYTDAKVTSVGGAAGAVSNAQVISSFTAGIAPGTSANVLTSNGSAWISSAAGGGGGVTITNDTTTNSSAYYPMLATVTTGSLSTSNVSSTKLTFNPSTGTLSATIFQSLSDVSFKTNIKPINNAGAMVAQLQGVGYDWVDGSGGPQFGLIAQDVEKVIPAIVGSSNNHKTINYAAVIPFLVEVIKELQDRVHVLERK